MALPKSVTKFSKNGVTFVDNVERTNYTITELTRAALKDVGKFITKETKKKIRKHTGRLAKNIQYWVRKQETDLLVGFKPSGFYGIFQELGTEKYPKIGALRNSTYDNIDTISEIESKYLSAIEDELKAQSLIDEAEDNGENDV